MEYSLTIKDIVGILLRDWKRILVVTVLCAALFGMAPMVLSSGGTDDTADDIAKNEKEIQAYEDWKDAKEQATDNVSEGLLSAYEQILEDPLMQIDPYDCVYRQITFAFDDENSVSRKRIVQSWIDGKFDEKKSGYLMYLYDVSGDIGEVTVTLWDSKDYDLDSTAQEMESHVVACSRDSGITIKVVNNVKLQGKSQVLFDKQDMFRNNTLKLQNEVGYFANSTALSEPSHISSGKGSRAILKYGIFGGIVGLVLGMVYAVFRAMRKGILVSSAQLGDFFAIPELGTYSAKDEGKTKLLAATVSVYGDECKGLFLFDDVDEAACSQLKMDLEKHTGKKFASGKGLTEDLISAEQLMRLDGVIVPVKLGRTTFKEVQQYIKWAQRFKKDVMGYIVLEA